MVNVVESDFTNTGMEALITSLLSLKEATNQRGLRLIGKVGGDVADLIEEMKESQSIRIADGYLPDNAEDFIEMLEGMRRDANRNLDQLKQILNAKIDTMVYEIEATDLTDVDAAQLNVNGYSVANKGGE